MHFILALLPILIILILMVGLRWGAARAGGAGYLSTLLLALLYFGADARLLAYAHAKALLLSIDVLLIIWAAFLLYRVADEAGAIRTIGMALPHLTADRGMQALIIGWVFASFLQGVGGFGVPVAVIAPLLVGLGFAPIQAVVIPSIGHGWAVTFGSLGSSFQALMASSGLPGETLAPDSALFLGISAFLVGLLVAHAAGGRQAMTRLLIPVVLLALVMGVTQYLVAVAGLWNIAAFSGGMLGLLVGIPLARRYKGETEQRQPLALRSVVIALSGYAILIGITLAVQVIPGIGKFLGQVIIQVEFPELVSGLGHLTPAGLGRSIAIFRHPGAILTYSSIIAFLIYKRAGLYQSGASSRIIKGTIQKVMSSSVSIASMVAMAVIMEHVGMIEILAQGLAGSMGMAFPIVAPWIGALGAFMTGSNTNSNVVFGALQVRTAELLNYQASLILAGQTSGAGLASVMAPTKIVVGASTAGMAGREGEVMRQLLVYTGLLVLLISGLTMGSILLENNNLWW
jgi:lactate permease